MRHIITTQYTSDEFKSLIDTAVKEALQQLIPLVSKSTNSPPLTTALLTRKDACRRLHISLPTLSGLVKSGKIKASIIGNSYRFSEKDILDLINKK